MYLQNGEQLLEAVPDERAEALDDTQVGHEERQWHVPVHHDAANDRRRERVAQRGHQVAAPLNVLQVDVGCVGRAYVLGVQNVEPARDHVCFAARRGPA